MLKQRLLTVAVVLPLLLALLFLAPNQAWGLLSAIPIALGAFEWGRLSRFSRPGRVLFVLAVAASCAGLLALLFLFPTSVSEVNTLYTLCFAATVFWMLAAPAWLYFHWRVESHTVAGIVGWIVLVPAWLAVLMLQRVPLLLFLTLGVVWIADTAAYFAGRRYGRRKLAPQISPGKTVEGLVGAYLAVIIYGLAVSLSFQSGASWAVHVEILVFAIVLTTLSVCGDLFESWIKRQAGVKDSGQLLPGHGGVLDRIDSLTATMPFAALFFAGMLVL